MLTLTSSFSVIDSHTAGHPTRVILIGIPSLKGESVRDKRGDCEARHDDLRPLRLHEPRGHAAMVGLVPRILIEGELRQKAVWINYAS